MQVLRFLTSFDAPVRRRDYLIAGTALAALKYAGDVALVWFGAARLWTPVDYLWSVWSLLGVRFRGDAAWILPAMAIWTLPFIWFGVTLTARRAMNAGLTPASACWFFVPFVNYLAMAVFSLLPDDAGLGPRGLLGASEPPTAQERAPQPTKFVRAALPAVAVGVALALAMVGLCVALLRVYSGTLFFFTPFVMGGVSAYRLNRHYAASVRETMWVTTLMFVVSGGALVLLATEGLVCLIMAFPLALGMGALGALLGREVARQPRTTASSALVILLALPASAVVEPAPISTLHEVRSAVEIDAPPEAVWREVIAFSPIPPPTELIFRAGIAYPTRARIAGVGVGAVRYCEFSTGAFVEPITAWEPGRRLAFDVTSSPPPLREWSLYSRLTPPHLDGYLRSRRGEFRLIALPDGRTRLEGSTWYEVHIAPIAYWKVFSDALIRAIHLRVLNHISRTAVAAS